MANTLSKLTTAGNLYTTGTLDEATFNPNSGYTKNLLNNSNFVGGTSGTIGSGATPPTNYITGATGGTLTYAPALSGIGNSTTFAVSSARNYYQQYNYFLIPPSAILTYSCTIESNSNTFSPTDIFAVVGSTLVTNTSFYLNGISIGKFLVFSGTGKFQCVFSVDTNKTFALNECLIRIGPGSSAIVTGGTITIANPQLEFGNTVTTSASIISYQPTNVSRTLAPTNALSKLDTNGNYYTAGTIDEVTFNPIQTEYRKNLFDYSDLNPTFWTFSNGTITQNTNVAPDNTFTATTLTGSTATVPFFGSSVVIVPGVTYTQSIYAKAGTQSRVMMLLYGVNFNNNGANQSVTFDLSLGTVITSAGSPQGYGIQSVGNGWYRIYITGTATRSAADNTQMIRFQDGIYVSGNYAYVWGPQIEVGFSPTIYSPTNFARPSSNTLSKLDTAGNHYLSGTYDEFTKGENLVTDGLIYYFDPAKTESWNGNTRVYDITKTQAPGTMVGNYTYSTDGGGSITLDAKTGYVDTGIRGNNTQLTANSQFTMSVWVKFTGKNLTLPMNSFASGTVFGCFNFDGFGIDWLNQGGTTMFPRSVRGVIRIGGVATIPTTDYLINLNTDLNRWLNLVWVYSSLNLANTNILYVNTVASGPNASASNTSYNVISSGGDRIQIGGPAISQGANPGAGTLPGKIGQALIYNRALTTTEIIQNFNEMRSQYGV